MTNPFDIFWTDPRLPKQMKQGKGAARKAFHKHVPANVSVDELWAGIERTKQGKPDWQEFTHLATFINGERYDDEFPEDSPVKDMGYEERRQYSAQLMKVVK